MRQTLTQQLLSTAPLISIGEYAAASIDGTTDDAQSGVYGQVGYHFLPGAMQAFPNSIFAWLGLAVKSNSSLERR